MAKRMGNLGLLIALMIALSACQNYASGTRTHCHKSTAGGTFSMLTCTGGASAIHGRYLLGFGGDDSPIPTGTYNVEATFFIEEGFLSVTTRNEELVGEVSPEQPLTLSGLVDVDSTDLHPLAFQLEAQGGNAVARGLSYDITAERR